jgi:phosphopantothenoylcysteine decarboxylase/phosphopantothenate--cysteine ligase
MSMTPRRPWRGRRVLLGVTGGIAAYKAVQLARDLTRSGAEVDVVMTASAAAFVGPISFEGVTGRPVAAGLLEPGAALAHIRLAREADVVCVAPATADFLARAAVGRSDDLLGAVLLATRAPVVVCPAMNDRMWSHPATLANAETLRSSLGYRLCGPAAGPLAFDEGEGEGRMEEPAVILQHVGRALEPENPYSGKRVVVTAGPTREPLDPVRFLSNRSTGRMGVALASAAWRRGAEVLLVHGPLGVELPAGPATAAASSAEAMRDAVRNALPGADALVMAAAVADFRPSAASPGKIKKADGPPTLDVAPAPDVLAETLEDRPGGLATLGFALETDDGLDAARDKLARKKLDLIALNVVGDGTGFETDTNRVTLVDREGGEERLPLQSKDETAEAILDRFARFLSGR